MQKKDPKTRDEAWVGDAVLALFAREWIIRELSAEGEVKTELFRDFTSNQFLNSFGHPTEVEAKIGRLYEEKGLSEAFIWMEETLVPVFLRQLKKKRRQN